MLSLENNLLLGCNRFYGNPAVISTIANVNALDGEAVSGGTARVGGNIDTSLSLVQLFVDWEGPDGDVMTMKDND